MDLHIKELAKKKVTVNGVLRKENWGGIYYYRDRMQIDKINETFYTFMSLLKQKEDVYSAYKEMIELYEVDEKVLRSDLEELVKYMMKLGMINVEGYFKEQLGDLTTNYKDTEEDDFVLGVGNNVPVAPIKVLIETTYNCNLKCVHCFADAECCTSAKRGILPGELELDDWKKIIDNICEAGVFDIFVLLSYTD